jgi:hypothetical protein
VARIATSALEHSDKAQKGWAQAAINAKHVAVWVDGSTRGGRVR